MIPAVIVAAAIGSVLVFMSGQLRFAITPLIVIALWLMLRLLTPPDGMTVTTICSTPGAIVLLWHLLAALISMIVLIVIDIHIFGHPFRAPLEPHHTLIFTPPLIIALTGVFFSERKRKQHNLANEKSRTCASSGTP
jgi:hypothetical protein